MLASDNEFQVTVLSFAHTAGVPLGCALYWTPAASRARHVCLRCVLRVVHAAWEWPT